MYSNEYRWTKLETKKTTISIDTDNESNKNTHSMFKISTVNQERGNTTKQLVDNSTTSKKIKRESKKQKKIENIESKAAPLRPIKRPKHNKLSDEKRGKKTNNKYIINKDQPTINIYFIKISKFSNNLRFDILRQPY